MQDIDESYPDDLPVSEVALYIAGKKADTYRTTLADDELVITADTVVIVDDEILGKPADEADAERMLRLISGRTHHVTTGVCILTRETERRFAVTTDVTFKQLSDEGRTLVVVSHDLDMISRICDRGVVLSSGTVQFEGPADQAVAWLRERN